MQVLWVERELSIAGGEIYAMSPVSAAIVDISGTPYAPQQKQNYPDTGDEFFKN